MKKRLLSWLMVLTLCLTLLPTAALADTGAGESSGSEKHEHYLCGTSHTCSSTWDNTKRTFKAWTSGNSLPTTIGEENGYYYLTTNVELEDTWAPTTGMTLCLNGHSITMKDNKSVISFNNTYGSLTLVDCKGDSESGEYGQITHASGSGHGVELTGGTFTMYGGNITGNTAGSGGGVYMTGRSTFNLYGGQITSNTATGSGGGVYSEYGTNHNSTFNMYGGQIADNNGNIGGGGVFYGNGTFTMRGGEISGNSGGGGHSKNGGGGVCIVGAMTVSGDVEITGNTEVTDSVSTNNNVYLRGSDAVITIDGALTGGAGSIGVSKSTRNLTAGKSVKIAEGKNYTLTDDDLKAFSSDAGDPYHIQKDENTLKLVNMTDTPHTHFLCTTDNTCTKVGGHTENGKTTFATKLWMDGTTLMKGSEAWELTPTNLNGSETALYVLPKGSYYLGSDIKLTASICIREDVQLCLNGWSIISDDYNLGSVIVDTNSSDAFTLTDCQNSGSITHAVGQGGGGVYMNGNSTKFNMYGGTITGNNSSGVDVTQTNTFNMYGGSITNNSNGSSGYGGGVYNGGTVNMYGGEISGNTASNKGGGVYMAASMGNYQGGILNVSGSAKITDNTVNGAANNVYLPSGKTFTLGSHFTKDTYIGVTTAEKPTDKKHVTIVSNAGTMSYDNVVKADDSENYKTQMDGADLVLALKDGGSTPGVHTDHFLCTTGTACTGIGGHSCVETHFGEISTLDDLKRAASSGGNYYLKNSIVLTETLNITKNLTLCLNGKTITGPDADSSDGYVIKVDGKSTADSVIFTLTDCQSEQGKITHAENAKGGGVNVPVGTFNMYGGSIADNTRSDSISGVHVGAAPIAIFNMYGGSIHNNKAAYGGVSVDDRGIFHMYGGKISGNTAMSNGGGVIIHGGATFTVSDSAQITGNMNKGNVADNVYLADGKKITIGGALNNDANIGVTTANTSIDTVVAEPATGVTLKDTDAAKFTSNNTNYSIILKDGKLVLGEKGSNPQPGKVDAGVNITAENANDPAPTEVVYGDTFKLGTTLKSTGTAGSPQSSKWTWSSSNDSVLAVTGSGSAATVKALKPGTATITVTYESEGAEGRATATIKVNRREISVKADNKDMTVGGALPTFTVTYGNFADNDTAATVLETQPVPTTTADGKTAGTFDITVEAPTIKSDCTDKYIVGTPQKGTLTVKAASTPSTPSSGSSSGSSTTTKTETTTNPDGSVTKTETRSDGTVIETTTNPDGSTSKTESKTTTKSNGSTVETVTETNTGADGSKSTSKTETTTAKDGSKTETKSETKTEADGTKSETKSETKTDANGVTSGTETTKTTAPNGSTGTTTTTTENGNTKTEAEAKVSEKAIEDAKKSGEAVKVPTEVKAGENSDSAPTVKVELPKNAGETKIEIPVSDVNSGTVAVIVHPDGTEEIVKDSKPTADGVELTVDGSATVKVIDNSKDFIDTRNHWSRDEVNFVASREIFNGVGGNLFGVGQPMTRGMVNTVLARLAGIDTTPENGQKWYEVGTEWAKANGITDGTNPEASVTREQLATLLYRFCGTPEVSGVLSFADAGEVSDYAQSALLWATQNDILNGVGNNRVAPNADAQRAQVAAMMARYLKNVG